MNTLEANSKARIADLRNDLGYGTSTTSKKSDNFNFIITSFRKAYKTPDQRPGEDLYDWYSDKDQADLDQMVHFFLVSSGFGPVIWPDDGKNAKGIEYPRDQEK